jgi:hypothetical protein
METQPKTFPDLVVVAHDKGKQEAPCAGTERQAIGC